MIRHQKIFLGLILAAVLPLSADVVFSAGFEKGPSYTIPPVSAGSQAVRPQEAATIQYDQDRLIAGHVLRRLGFGPAPSEMNAILQMGPAAYINQQLNPLSIDDSLAESKLPPKPRDRSIIQKPLYAVAIGLLLLEICPTVLIKAESTRRFKTDYAL